MAPTGRPAVEASFAEASRPTRGRTGHSGCLYQYDRSIRLPLSVRSIDLSLLPGNVMHLHKMLFAAAAMLPLISCSRGSCPPTATCEAGVLLQDDFETENNHLYALNYTGFAQWTVVKGTVDLVGTPPFDDFLPPEQGMYVDLDGSMLAAGTLQSRELFTLAPGRYRLSLMMAGMPRPNQPPNTVIISVGDAFSETVTLPSFA